MLYVNVIRFFLKNYFSSRIRHVLKLGALKIKLLTRCALNNYSQKLFEIGCYSSQQIRGQNQEFHHPHIFLRELVCCNTSTISFFLLASSSSKTFLRHHKWDIKFDILDSRRYSAASNSKRQVEVRCNSNFSETEPALIGSTKPVTLITK